MKGTIIITPEDINGVTGEHGSVGFKTESGLTILFAGSASDLLIESFVQTKQFANLPQKPEDRKHFKKRLNVAVHYEHPNEGPQFPRVAHCFYGGEGTFTVNSNAELKEKYDELKSAWEAANKPYVVVAMNFLPEIR